MFAGLLRPSRKGLHWMVLVGLAIAAAQTCGQDTIRSFAEMPSRKWTSADGKFSVEGKLVAVDGTKVSLQLDNGKRVSVELPKLSDGDRRYVTEALAAGDSSPFMEESDDSAGFGGGFDGGGSGDAANQGAADLAGMREIDLKSNAPLDLQAEHWQPVAAAPIQPFRVKSYSPHARELQIISNRADTVCAISFHEPFGGKDADHPKSWVTLVDLKTGETKAEVPLPSENAVVGDLSPDGSILAIFNEQRGPTEPQIGVYRVDGKQLVPVRVWDPSEAAGFFKHPISTRFLANGDLVMETFDQLIVWQLNPLAAKYRISKEQGEWQLAADRVHAWVGRPDSRYEVDLVQGTCTGKDSANAATIWANSPDGTRRARLEGRAVILQSANGEPLDSFFTPDTWPNTQLEWIDDRFLKLPIPNRDVVLDTANRVALAEVVRFGSRRIGGWVVDRDGGGRQPFLRISRPDSAESDLPDWKELAETLPAQGDDLLVLRPGDRVRLDVQLTAEPGSTAEATRAIRAWLAERGVEVDSNAEWTLAARSTKQTEQVEYRQIGTPPWQGTETVNVTTTIKSITLTRGQEPVWSYSSAYGPGFMMMMREGETAQQAADRLSSSGTDFWTSLQLPKHIAQHPQGQAWFSYHLQDGNLQKVR